MATIKLTLGSCPSGPTAASCVQQWMLEDGRLVETWARPANRHGDVESVRVYVWSRDGYVHDAFGSASAEGVTLGLAERWLTDHGASEIADWPATIEHRPVTGYDATHGDQRWISSDRAAWICAWYDLHGIDMPVQPSYCFDPAPAVRVMPRVVGGTRRRRNARRRVNA